MPSPLLISLPRGLSAGGVSSWAIRTAIVLAQRDRQVCLMVHREDPGTDRLNISLPPQVRLVDLAHLPPVDTCSGDLSHYIPAYRDALRSLVAATRLPVIVAPTLLGDTFGIAAALSLADPELMRVAAWQHSPIPYDAAVLARYEPLISLFVGVSDEITAALRAAHPFRNADIKTILHGVHTPVSIPPRPPVENRPLTMIYAGRMENDLKRASSLIDLSDELHARGVNHRLTLVGDGPAAGEIDTRIGEQGRAARIRRLRPVPPEGVLRLLTEHDLFLLPSRVEGLSLSVMEAMAAGCVPIITRTPSGSGTLVDHEQSGILVDLPATADNAIIARAFGDAISRAGTLGIPALSAAAHRKAAERFSLTVYADHLDHAFEAAVAAPPRRWPTDRPCAFTTAAATTGSGAVPADGATRLRNLLARLAGKSIVIHGTGRHTIELASTLAQSPARITAFSDDDPSRHGQTLWNWPIIAPASAARTGASDVVISSWMNQDAIWDRREVYERQGLFVHRIYM